MKCHTSVKMLYICGEIKNMIIMEDNLNTDWAYNSDRGLSKIIGNFVKHHRLNQNKTQGEVAESAGISRSTLSLLERGEKVMLSSLICVLRVLDLLYIMDVFKIEDEISPIEYSKLQKKAKRQRARSNSNINEAQEDIGW